MHRYVMMPDHNEKTYKKEKHKKRRSKENSLSKYQVLGVIGEGAYGVVIKCVNKKTKQVVALKKFKESGDVDKAVRKTILREVKTLKLMKNSKCVVQLLESFKRKGTLYLVFEFVERNLLEIIEENENGVPVSIIARYTYQLCNAIAECHKLKVCHTCWIFSACISTHANLC